MKASKNKAAAEGSHVRRLSLPLTSIGRGASQIAPFLRVHRSCPSGKGWNLLPEPGRISPYFFGAGLNWTLVESFRTEGVDVPVVES
jgi:hypothetical protein